MTDTPEPECKDAQGCHRVVACIPGCSVTARAMYASLTAAPVAGLGADTPDSHTVRNGTFLHGGPREGCTLPGCATEQADGDQAREQLAELIEHRKAGDKECARLAAELDQAHESAEKWRKEAAAMGDQFLARRRNVARVFGQPDGMPWASLTRVAEEQRNQAAIDVAAAEQAARAARQGEAEAIRARTAAEQRAREADSHLGIVMGSLGRVKAVLRETENQLAASRKDAAKARIRSGLNIMEARRNYDAWRNARKRAAERTAVLRSTRHNFEMKQRHLSEAEATLAAVREITGERPTVVLPWSEIDSRLTAIRAALGDPQPAAEVCCVCGCPDVTYHNFREQPFCCRCAECCEPPVLCAHGCQPPAKAEPLTVPVSPREQQDAEPDHPMYSLAEAMEGPPIERYEAYGLIKAYYDAITSAPPANPAERPLAITVQTELTPEQVRKVVKRAARMANLGRELGR